MSYSRSKDFLSNRFSTQTSQNLFRKISNEIDKNYEAQLLRLLQAVLDDNRDTVATILNQTPELILLKPANLIIESQYTSQKFYAEDALTIAVQRKQIKMIELLLSYYNKLEQTDHVKKVKEEALLKWSYYDLNKNVNRYYDVMGMGFKVDDEIIIPPQYKAPIQSLIDVFSTENFPNGVKTECKLSDRTEEALRLFKDKTLSSNSKKLADCFDQELLLQAAYKLYFDNVKKFQNDDQSNFFARRVVGFLQSLVSPETASVLCEGLLYVVQMIESGSDIKIGQKAAKLKTQGGQPFYQCGLGSKYFINANLEDSHYFFGKFLLQKQQMFKTLINSHDNEINDEYRIGNFHR